MKRLFNLFIVLAVVLFTMAACDKIEPPFKEEHGGGDNPGDTTVVLRKVLLEDYTGHRCVNCAGAAQTAHQLQELYEGQVILMSVHAGDFAKPVPGSIFTADYRTEAGNQWNDFFGVQAYPSGMVNRADYNGEVILPETKWGEALAAALEPEADADIKIQNEFAKGLVTTIITVKFLHEMPDLYSLQVCITEDSIVSAQLNNDENAGEVPVIENFVFMHMLRGDVNGIWGEDIFGGAVEPGKEYTVTYTKEITGVPEHSHVVAFVYEQNAKTVIQAEEAPVIAEE